MSELLITAVLMGELIIMTMFWSWFIVVGTVVLQALLYRDGLGNNDKELSDLFDYEIYEAAIDSEEDNLEKIKIRLERLLRNE